MAEIKTRYIIKRAHLERDKEEILSVWDRNGVNGPNSEHHFDWAYENNTAGQGPILFIVDASSSLVVGTAGLILRRMKIQDTVLLAGRAGGFAVDNKHRSLGPALMLQNALLNELGKSDLALIYSMTPVHAAPVFKRLKFRMIGESERRRKITSTTSSVLYHFPAAPKFARWSLSKVMDLGIHALSMETWVRLGRSKLTRIIEFDSRFDELWLRAAPQYSFTSERSSAFLRWRFFNNPGPRKFLCDALSHSDGSLRGYIIYYVDGYNTAHIVDLFAEDKGSATYAILSALAWRLRDDGVSAAMFSTVSAKQFSNMLRMFGFWKWHAPTPHKYKLFISPPCDQFPQADLTDIEWGFLMADDFLDYL